MKEIPVVLVVEDDETTRNLIAAALREEGLHVLTAGDGHDALDILHSMPDVRLVLTDGSMPRVDGPTLHEEARRIGLSTPFLALTSSIYAQTYFQGVGVEVLHKPPCPRALRRATTRALGSA